MLRWDSHFNMLDKALVLAQFRIIFFFKIFRKVSARPYNYRKSETFLAYACLNSLPLRVQNHHSGCRIWHWGCKCNLKIIQSVAPGWFSLLKKALGQDQGLMRSRYRLHQDWVKHYIEIMSRPQIDVTHICLQLLFSGFKSIVTFQKGSRFSSWLKYLFQKVGSTRFLTLLY